jgi:hypothetical protein
MSKLKYCSSCDKDIKYVKEYYAYQPYFLFFHNKILPNTNKIEYEYCDNCFNYRIPTPTRYKHKGYFGENKCILVGIKTIMDLYIILNVIIVQKKQKNFN